MTLAPDAAEGFADMAWLMNATEDAASGARLMNATGDMAGMARTVNRAGGTTTSRETATRITELDELERFYENIFNAQREINEPYEEFLEELRRLRDDIDGSTCLFDDAVEGGTDARSSRLVFGSNTKPAQKLSNQMSSRGWTEELIRDTVDNPFTTRGSINKATGNAATVFYTEQGSYVIVDNVTNEIVQISDNINPLDWIPDTSIENPYKP